MELPGFLEYQRREYCKDVRCPVQIELQACEPGSTAYQTVRQCCQNECVHTAHEFHHWLTEHGYLVVKPVDKP